MAEPVLAATGLRKTFAEVVAVDGVDLEVAQGGSLAIVGESGSGKTTVARLLIGLTAPTAGTITACGPDRSTPSRSSKERRRRGGERGHRCERKLPGGKNRRGRHSTTS